MLYIKNYFAQVNLNIIFSEAVFYFLFFFIILRWIMFVAEKSLFVLHV